MNILMKNVTKELARAKIINLQDTVLISHDCSKIADRLMVEVVASVLCCFCFKNRNIEKWSYTNLWKNPFIKVRRGSTEQFIDWPEVVVKNGFGTRIQTTAVVKTQLYLITSKSIWCHFLFQRRPALAWKSFDICGSHLCIIKCFQPPYVPKIKEDIVSFYLKWNWVRGLFEHLLSFNLCEMYTTWLFKNKISQRKSKKRNSFYCD